MYISTLLRWQYVDEFHNYSTTHCGVINEGGYWYNLAPWSCFSRWLKPTLASVFVCVDVSSVWGSSVSYGGALYRMGVLCIVWGSSVSYGPLYRMEVLCIVCIHCYVHVSKASSFDIRRSTLSEACLFCSSKEQDIKSQLEHTMSVLFLWGTKQTRLT